MDDGGGEGEEEGGGGGRGGGGEGEGRGGDQRRTGDGRREGVLWAICAVKKKISAYVGGTRTREREDGDASMLRSFAVKICSSAGWGKPRLFPPPPSLSLAKR